MAWKPVPPLSIALAFFRSSAEWSRERLAEAAGTTKKRIGEWEAGYRTLSRRRAVALLTILGFSAADLDEVLEQIARRRAQAHGGSASGSSDEKLSRVGADLAAFLTRELATQVRLHQADEARSEAVRLWKRLSKRTIQERKALVEESARFQTWALALRLGEESARAAADRADRALELAELAVSAAGRAPMPGPLPDGFRKLVLADCFAFLGNARRVAGQLPLADGAFHRSELLAQEGEGCDPDRLLDPARRLDLEASLRMYQGRLAEALALLERALATGAVGEARGRILLNKAVALEQGGLPERAIEALREAASVVTAESDPRSRFGLTFNLGVNLCHLERFAEASALLPEIRALGIEGRQELDLVRVTWLEGRAIAGLGNREEGSTSIEQVYRDFEHLGIEYDAGLAALELAALRIELGRPGEARTLAEGLVARFQDQGVERDLLAALALWVEAARQQSATADSARALLRQLERRRPLEAAEPGERS